MSETEKRNYKDTVFCLLFEDKNNLLELYNALNDTQYTDVDGLEVVTLEATTFLRFRNDAAFTFNNDLSMYEQQSTANPNAPLRMLHYISDEYHMLIRTKDLYRHSIVKIPTPTFVIFYNGTAAYPERQTYRLSDMFEKPTDEPALELVTTVLNINDGHNRELLEKCRTLSEYMTFVNTVRRNKSNRMSINSAVTSAVDECIENNVLKDFFKEHREEVLGMGRMEFDEEAFKEAMYEDGYEDGEKAGLEKGMAEGMEKGVEKGLEKTAVSLLTTDMRLEDIAKHTGLTIERVRELAG